MIEVQREYKHISLLMKLENWPLGHAIITEIYAHKVNGYTKVVITHIEITITICQYLRSQRLWGGLAMPLKQAAQP